MRAPLNRAPGIETGGCMVGVGKKEEGWLVVFAGGAG